MANKPKITLEQTILVQRIAEEDFTAIKPLWISLFGYAVDEKRPVEDIMNDISSEVATRVPPKKEAPKPAPMTLEELLELGARFFDLTNQTKAKA